VPHPLPPPHRRALLNCSRFLVPSCSRTDSTSVTGSRSSPCRAGCGWMSRSQRHERARARSAEADRRPLSRASEGSAAARQSSVVMKRAGSSGAGGGSCTGAGATEHRGERGRADHVLAEAGADDDAEGSGARPRRSPCCDSAARASIPWGTCGHPATTTRR
jgi:hypothetical protein